MFIAFPKAKYATNKEKETKLKKQETKISQEPLSLFMCVTLWNMLWIIIDSTDCKIMVPFLLLSLH